MTDMPAETGTNSIELATELTIAWLNNPNVHPSPDDALGFLRAARNAIDDMAKAPETPIADAKPEYVPAVSVRSSVKPDYIISLIDGRKFKSLTRHLSSQGLTPAEYRARFGLKPDYPMVAANYAAERRAIAVKLGLGQKGRAARADVAKESTAEHAAAPAKPVKRGGSKTSDAAVPEAAAMVAAAEPAKRAGRTAKPKIPAEAAPAKRDPRAAAATNAAAPTEVATPAAKVSSTKAAGRTAKPSAEAAAPKPKLTLKLGGVKKAAAES